MDVRETAANSIVGNCLPAASSGIASDAIAPNGILQLGMSFWGSKALLSAVELGVFTALASGPAYLEALRERIGLHPRAARDFLDALVALKMLEREGDVYRDSAAADTFLDKAKPSYIGGMLEMANTQLYGFWGSLTEALRTGEHQNEGKHGEDFFAAIYANPEVLHAFLTAMSGISAGAAHAIAAKVSLGRSREFRGYRCRAGNGTGHFGARVSSSAWDRFRSCSSSAGIRGICG